MIERIFKRLARGLGYDLVRRDGGSPLATLGDLSSEEQQIILKARPYTMTSPARMAALLNSVNYISQNNIPGDIAECGVWRGGSMMIVALALLARGDRSRSLYLYDTFEGMSDPTELDKSNDGTLARDEMDRTPKGEGVWCYAGIDDVRRNILSTGYPADKIHLVKGKVEDTIPGTMPGPLALLRLDTDWYESTRHELDHLYPLLDSRGILILDDYGYWQGARKAVDEYFAARGERVFLHRIDSTGRILVGAG